MIELTCENSLKLHVYKSQSVHYLLHQNAQQRPINDINFVETLDHMIQHCLVNCSTARTLLIPMEYQPKLI